MATSNDLCSSGSEFDEKPDEMDLVVENDRIASLLEKKRRETMYELRKLRMGERSVSVGDSRRNLDYFFSNRMEASRKAAENENVPLNSQNVEQHRPESVVVEVTTLFENRPVTSMLQSARFRRQLENIVRSSISQLHRTDASRPQAFISQQGTPTASTLPPAVDEQNPPEVLHQNSQAVHSISSNQAQPARPSVTSTIPESPQPQRNEEFFSNDNWNRAVRQDRREDLIADISELVQRQLVTNTLNNGPSRPRLEAVVGSRLETSGTDGGRVLDFIRTIHSEDLIERNDFSNLGIFPVVDDSTDSMSMISATAHAVPYSQSNLAVNREIKSLKSEFSELKKMLQLSLDMQMDMQRAVRQEISAAINTNSTASQAALGATNQIHSYPINDGQCLICLEKEADTVLYMCGHLCMCQGCAFALKDHNPKCPVCRAPIRDMIRVFKCTTKKLH